MSDEGAIENIVTRHKWRSTAEGAAIAAVKAGCNLELTNHRPYFYSQVKNNGLIIVFVSS